jgi:hypothetical protein
MKWLAILLFLSVQSALAQSSTVLYEDNCEASGYTWRGIFSNANVSYISGVSSPQDSPANAPRYSSFNTSIALFGVGNPSSAFERADILFPNITGLNPNVGHCIRIRMASFGINPAVNTGAGVDNQDYLQMNVAYNGANNFSPEVKVNGSNNITWGYSSTAVINRTSQGALGTYSLSPGFEYSTINLELPIGTTQVALEIILSCNGAGESWFIDDIQILSGCYSALPIELLSFEAKSADNAVDLSWTTATEINNDYFTIEKSKSGFDFFEVCRVDGAGNSISPIYYEFSDKDPLDGISYYRLRQTDYDGTIEVFSPVAVRFWKKVPYNPWEWWTILGQRRK